MPPKLVELDGRTLEGGGQLLRLAVSLSSLTHQPIRVHHIRGNRMPHRMRKKSKADQKVTVGGMKMSHLVAVSFIAKAVDAETEGMELGSSDLAFYPGADTASQGHSSEVLIEQSKPGSIALVLQAVLPYFLFRSRQTTKLRVTGGTHGPRAPTIDYVQKVFFKTLDEHLGIPGLEVEVLKRGFASETGGMSSIGEVVFTIPPMRRPIQGFNLANRGELKGFEVTVLADGESIREQTISSVVSALGERFPGQDVKVVVEDSTDRGCFYLLVIALFEAGEAGKSYRLPKEYLRAGGRKAIDVKKKVEELVQAVGQDVEGRRVVDKNMADQLVVFQALAKGETFVDEDKQQQYSLHTQTAIWVVEKMLRGIRFNQGRCVGMGFSPTASDGPEEGDNISKAMGELKV